MKNIKEEILKSFKEKFFYPNNVSILVGKKRVYGPIKKLMFTPNRVESFLSSAIDKVEKEMNKI